MQLNAQEFVYRIAGMAGGSRPGSHRSRSRGAGMAFAAHARLFDQPDPRRIDLRASIGAIPRDWLVRSSYQAASITVSAVIDVSASMHFGSAQSKLGVVADFLEALGRSAHRVGDAVRLMAFDQGFRDDLYLPARRGRGAGSRMAEVISSCLQKGARTTAVDGLAECVDRIDGNGGLVFLISDFHWPLDRLPGLLLQLDGVQVVPLVVWDPAEIDAPLQDGLLSLYDAESGQAKRLWVRRRTRQQWRANVNRRRAEIAAVFAARDIRSFHIDGSFDGEQLSRYFLEQVA